MRGINALRDPDRCMREGPRCGARPRVGEWRQLVQGPRLDVLDDPRHRLDHQARVVAHTGLARKHERVGAVEHRVGDVTRLRPGRPRGHGHGVEHLRGHDHRLRGLAAQLDRSLLHERHGLQREFDAEIAPRHHHPVERRDDLLEVLDGLRLLDFGQHRKAHALLVHDRVHIDDVGRRAHERQRDHVGTGAQRPPQVVLVLVRQGRHAHRHSGQVEPLVVGDPPTLDDLGVHSRAVDLGHTQFDAAVVDQDEVTGCDVVREAHMRGRDHRAVARHRLGGDDELISRREQDGTGREGAEPDLGPLQVDEDAHAATDGISRSTHMPVDDLVIGMLAVGQIQTRDVHSRLHEPGDGLGSARGRPEGGDDLRATHGPQPTRKRLQDAGGQTSSGRAVAGIGDGRLVAPIRNESTLAAAARPSAMAQTISDCPRPASPATNTPGTSVE